MMNGWILGGLALTSLACSIYMLQAAWRSKQDHSLSLGLGWGLFIISLVLFSYKDGPEKGIALGLVGFAILAVCVLIFRYIRATSKEARDIQPRVIQPENLGWTIILRRIFIGLLVAIFAGLAALSFSAGVFSCLKSVGVEHTANLVIAMMLFPLIWASLAVVIGVDGKLWRKTLVTLGTGLIPLVYFIVGT